MERAGVHPAYVYATRVCGFVLTQGNEDSLTADQVARWHEALDTWFAEHPEPR